jgi:cardiolipin synthase
MILEVDPIEIIKLLLAVIFTIIVLGQRKQVIAVTLAWILMFFSLPFIGIALFLLLGYHNLSRRLRLKLKSVTAHTAKPLIFNRRHNDQKNDPLHLIPLPTVDLKKVALTAERLTNFPVVPGNELHLYSEAEITYKAIIDVVQQAKHHIHMLYYAFQADETGTVFRDLLVEKAKSGVVCRLLVDDIGSFRLTQRFLQPMLEAGVEVAHFLPVRISRPWGLQLRNHRKLIVIDGKIGFIGSQNIGNEYRRRINRKLSWRDTHLKIQGPAVTQLQTIFSEDWLFTTQKTISGDDYFPTIAPAGTATVQTLPTGPDENELALEIILTSLIHTANQHITITTPYLVPSLPLLVALEAAVKRGVRVQILVPRKSDHWLIGQVGKSWYRDLLQIGSELYEFSAYFIHAKMVTIDDQVALLGSANMDERSYHLNFECGVLLYDRLCTNQWTEIFSSMIAEAQRFSLQKLEKQSVILNVRDGLFRILSPII